ncbi:MAG: helix-turn-helix domain-containing protein [Dolichospermum sp. OL01]|nr:helix-turn-helix domain-containing protein [Dolichospermum sp. OL01]
MRNSLWYSIENYFYSKMLKVVKVRLYPDAHQQQSLAQAFGSCRWLLISNQTKLIR